MLVALQEAAFVCTVKSEIDDTLPASLRRELQQIWFAHSQQLKPPRRFCTGFLLVIDGTFSTISLGLPLLVMVVVLNTIRRRHK